MRKLLLLMGVVVITIGQLVAQSRTITGKVTDTDGSPVPNVSVLVKGSSIGTTTGQEGTYSLSVPPNAKTLVFSSVGMGTVEIVIGDNSVVNATMKSAEAEMQEVVVVGYGTQKRGEVTGNISKIGGTKLIDQPVQSFDQGLSGRAAGVNIAIPNGV